MAKSYDFDEFWEEQNGKDKEKSITIENKEWEIKGKLPAAASLKFLNMIREKKSDDMVMVDEIIDIYEAIMGPENVQALLKTGIGTQKLFGLLQYIMNNIYDIYGKEQADEDDQKGKAKAQQAKQ